MYLNVCMRGGCMNVREKLGIQQQWWWTAWKWHPDTENSVLCRTPGLTVSIKRSLPKSVGRVLAVIKGCSSMSWVAVCIYNRGDLVLLVQVS